MMSNNKLMAIVSCFAALACTGLTGCASGGESDDAQADAAVAGTDPSAAVDLAALIGSDSMSHAMNCVVHLGQTDTVGGGDQLAMDSASTAWRAQLVAETNEQEASQLIASNVNMLADTPAAAREVAIAWCLDNAPG